MAFKLEREKTNTTPSVLIDEEKSYMRIEGSCYLENVLEFFKEINVWLADYLPSDYSTFTVDFELEYFNSSTTKILYNMLREMDKYSSEEKKVIVNWIAAEDDDMIIECGEDYQEEMENLDFKVVIKE